MISRLPLCVLAGKHLGGKLNPDALVVYEYTKSGQLAARTANGVRQAYEYDRKGQLLAVKDADGNAVERYCYDKAGNMLKKTVNGKTTTFAFDDANQLVSSTTDGVTTRYAYDAAGRLVREGNKRYTYGYLDKVMSVTDGDTTRTFTYHADGQLATANYGGSSESFEWDGLALIRRGDEEFVNEPHVGNAPQKLCFGGEPRAKRRARRARKGPRGNPVASSKGTSYFNDALGTTVGSKSNGKYSAAALTAFGENHRTTEPPNHQTFFTGKPYVEGLGHAFLMRNYRAGLAKWQTADPMGYPDGWNALAYCVNMPQAEIDYLGCSIFSDADPVVGASIYLGYTFGELMPIGDKNGVSVSGTDVWCKGTKIDHIDVDIKNSFSLNVKAALPSNTSSLITAAADISQAVLTALTTFISGSTVTVDVKPEKRAIPLEPWVCDAKEHTDVSSHRGKANARVMIRPYIDVYAQEHKSGNYTFFTKVNSYTITYEYITIKDCVKE